MRKLLIYSCTLLLVCCTVTSCSSDDAYGEDASSEAKLAWIKQQYLNYAQQYGITHIDFDDSKLMKHMNLTKADIERDVMTMAVSIGSYNGKTNTLRKKTRSGGVGDNEENGDHHTFVYVEGSYNKTLTRKDSIEINYSANYYFSELGARFFSTCLTSVKVQVQGRNSPIDIDTRNVTLHSSFDTYSGNIGGTPGETINIDLIYSLYVKIRSNVCQYEEYISETHSTSSELKEL